MHSSKLGAVGTLQRHCSLATGGSETIHAARFQQRVNSYPVASLCIRVTKQSDGRLGPAVPNHQGGWCAGCFVLAMFPTIPSSNEVIGLAHTMLLGA